jgi:hypothetical protein
MTGLERAHPDIRERLVIPRKGQAPHCGSPVFLPSIGWGVLMIAVVDYVCHELEATWLHDQGDSWSSPLVSIS